MIERTGAMNVVPDNYLKEKSKKHEAHENLLRIAGMKASNSETHSELVANRKHCISTDMII